MPTFHYRREDGTTFDFFQKMSDKALEVCPTTGQPVTRIISGGTGVLYKGEGWYVTDYKKKDSGSAAKPAAAKAPESTNTESKPDTAPAPAPAAPKAD